MYNLAYGNYAHHPVQVIDTIGRGTVYRFADK